MIKYIFITAITLFTINWAKANTKGDTIITFYKYLNDQPVKIDSPKIADFVRFVYPDSASSLYIVKEFYKTGVRKFLGKVDMDARLPHELTGESISYYTNGKKRAISNYSEGKKLGIEYLYRPDGRLYGTKKWVYNDVLFNRMLYWDCYDTNGNITCKDGNGKWIIYDDSAKNVIFSGSIIKGYMEGEWHGTAPIGVPIKYTITYKRGKFISGNSFDANSRTHPFTAIMQEVAYKDGSIFDFLDDLNKHLVLPKDDNGKKINIDTIHISFTIEKNGHVTGLRPLGNVNAKLKDALNTALTHCASLTPSAYYGIPYRTEMAVSLKIREEKIIIWSKKTIQFKGKVLEFLKPGENLDDDPF